MSPQILPLSDLHNCLRYAVAKLHRSRALRVTAIVHYNHGDPQKLGLYPAVEAGMLACYDAALYSKQREVFTRSCNA